MSGSRPKPAEAHLAEQHLGDRLSALVDGELGHDARERVLAHVATCAKCKSEVDAQRRLKSVFAQVAPPPPSESFLARLQGLPAGGDLGGPPPAGNGLPGDPPVQLGGTPGAFGPGGGRGERFEFAYTPARRSSPLLASPLGVDRADRSFRIHDVSRHEQDRSSPRGMRFAAAAAGAVSLAAIALGGVAAVTPTDAEVRGPGNGSNVTPLRSQGSTAATAPESQRRRGAVPLLGQLHGQSALGDAPAAPTRTSAPLLPGVSPPAPRHDSPLAAAPVMVGGAPMAPLTAPLVLSEWETAPGLKTPGGFPAAAVSSPPVPTGATAAPAPVASSRTIR
ncbi:anti-sigma factor family protein [Streptomyces sp. KMM 9044]|uniref:anti-sigma factor family protein n=1 Tax=Streptomyces sp. KMM 9044 TaxID=2744474 RepID=UPI0021513CC6|nr:zf-HC2 domain-containing protein [Streptomyces sp. KMM 9044]WAX78101.1 zf-HC2 domain-containing protein [Streptomyces sp. KMM 9044]